MRYQGTKKSLKTHQLPVWFDDAKLGVFIHWGLYSVPAWAVPRPDLEGIPSDYATSPYAEWYGNMVKIEGSPVWKHHRETWGENFTYGDFAARFRKDSENMKSEDWAAFIAKTGARYAIFTTKHHDGFCLWPSKHTNPRKKNWTSRRDIVGELAEALRARGLKFGAYYSGIWDWSFQPEAIVDEYSMLTNGDGSREYARYAYDQFTELIDRYRPDILWNDIGYPTRGRLKDMLAHYYNTVADGVVNNRWIQWRIPDNFLIRRLLKLILKIKDMTIKNIDWGATDLQISYGDFATPEYMTLDYIPEFKWECTRGVGSSFGYNSRETSEEMLSAGELIAMLVDIVSKNGNLLINIGPMADGTIPLNQQKPLLELGGWLERNGEAIYGSCPWIRAEALAECGTALRFTMKEDYLYIIIMGQSESNTLVVRDLELPHNKIELLDGTGNLHWEQEGNDCLIRLPANLPDFSVVRVSMKKAR